MYQHQQPEYFPNCSRLLPAIRDACVRYAFRMKPEEVSVVRYQNASRGGCECEVHRVVRTE